MTYSSLCDVLDHYRDSDFEADVAFVTGDLIHDDSAEAYGHFVELLGALDLPVYCLPGNHDVRNLMQQALADPPFYYCTSLESNNWLIVNLDSCVTGTAGGRIEAAELDRLGSEIAGSDAPHVMVCLHHPPVLMDSSWLDSVGLENREEFLARLSVSGKVRLALFGHVHQPYDAEHSGIRIIGTPSTCRQFAPKRTLFAVDDTPPAYRRIQLHDDGSFDHELVWLTT